MIGQQPQGGFDSQKRVRKLKCMETHENKFFVGVQGVFNTQTPWLRHCRLFHIIVDMISAFVEEMRRHFDYRFKNGT